MPKPPEGSGVTEYTAETLRTYRTSEGYLPGMRDQTRTANDDLAYYKTDTDRLRAGSPDFPPAAQLVAQLAKVCKGFEDEFAFNFSITDKMIVALADTGEAMEQAEENGTLSGSRFGKLVGKAITGNNGGSGSGNGSNTGSNNGSNNDNNPPTN